MIQNSQMNCSTAFFLCNGISRNQMNHPAPYIIPGNPATPWFAPRLAMGLFGEERLESTRGMCITYNGRIRASV